MAKFAVIGLGKFGHTVATTLFDNGAEVIAIDSNKKLTEEIKGRVSAAINMDSTDESALRENNIHEMDAVVLAIGNNIEVSILTSVILKKLGVSSIHAKVDSRIHARILEMLGVQNVVFPEEMIGIQLAHNILSTNVLQYYNLATGHSLVELSVPKEYIGNSLQDLALPTKKGVNVVAIKSDKLMVTEDGENKIQKVINDMPSANDIIKEGDTLVLIGPESKINNLIDETSKME